MDKGSGNLFARCPDGSDAALTGAYLDFVLRAGADQLIRQNRAIMARPDARLHLPQLRCPTLVMCGDADQLTPPDCSHEIAALVPGAELVLVPEFEPTLDEVAHRLLKPRREKLSHIIVVAEGDQPGRSLHIAAELKLRTGTEYRVCILGHTQRGGTPTAFDRKLASMMGAMAVRELMAGRSRLMTVFVGGQVKTAPFPEVHAMRRQMTERDLLELNEILAT